MKFLLIFLLSLQCSAQDINTLRNNFDKASTNKNICEEMINSISSSTKNSLFLGYLGAYQTIWAEHVSNPFSKLKTFNNGKKNIDNAINKDPNNIELRLIRYSIQLNAPKFLGYHKNIASDKKIIIENKNSIKNTDVLKFYNKLL